VMESRLKVLAPNPTISLRLRLRVLMGRSAWARTGSLVEPWYMPQLEDAATNHVPFHI
jgi:hypothetical protein